jgi:hypothetical protein
MVMVANETSTLYQLAEGRAQEAVSFARSPMALYVSVTTLYTRIAMDVEPCGRGYTTQGRSIERPCNVKQRSLDEIFHFVQYDKAFLQDRRVVEKSQGRLSPSAARPLRFA